MVTKVKGVSTELMGLAPVVAEGSTTIRTLGERFGEVANVLDFGADPTGTISSSFAIQSACDYLATKNGFEQSTSLYFPQGNYSIQQQILLGVQHGNMRWFSDGNCSLNIANLASEHPLVVDFSTGGTANFLKFDMENLHWTDTTNSKLRRGIHLKRVLGSRFTNCHFNYLAVAFAMDDDSNLNHFDSCQWRSNVRSIVGYVGGANNNVFTNCQWRYNDGIIIDCLGDIDYPATFEGTTFVGGDCEPFNGSDPIMRLDSTTMINMRMERNTNATPVFEVHDYNTFIDTNIASDGARQAYGFRVLGTENNIGIRHFSGFRAIKFEDTATNNSYNIREIVKLSTGKTPIVEDLGGRNVANIVGIPQVKGLSTLDDYVVTQDLTLWQSHGCSVVYDAGGKHYTITADGTETEAYIYVQFNGTGFTGNTIGLSANPLNSFGQLLVEISGTLPTDTSGNVSFPQTNVWKRGYFSTYNYLQNSVDNPYIVIQLLSADAGRSCRVRDVTVTFDKSLPSL